MHPKILLRYAANLRLQQGIEAFDIANRIGAGEILGVAGLIVTERHAPADTGVLAKAASGALEIVPLVRAVNLSRALDQLKEAGFWLYGLDEGGDVRIGDLDLGGRACIVLGAEGFSSNGTVPGLLRFVFDLAWMIWLVVMAWQRPQAVRPLATAPAVAS